MGIRLPKELEDQILSSPGVVIGPRAAIPEEPAFLPRTYAQGSAETLALPKHTPPPTAFEALCVHLGLQEPVPEYCFAPPRKWRFDWAWPELKIALEQDGAVHRIKDKFARDMEKKNEAAILGWRLLSVTPKMMENGSVFLLLERIFSCGKSIGQKG